MSKLINACCTVILASLSVASCSSLFNKNSEVADVVILADSLDLSSADSLTLQEIPAYELIDSLDGEDLHDDIYEAIQGDLEEEPVDPYWLKTFHFEEAQTTGIMIDEYKSTVVEDFCIDLRYWESHYPADGHVTSVYGWRKGRTHAGIDLKAYVGDNLYAAFDGVVRLSKYYSSFGNCIIIRHYNGLETLYAHASKLLVGVNDEVRAGDVIALAGNTGRSTGSHLHFEVRVNGNHFNPNLILDTEKRQIKDTNLYITMRNGRLFASNDDDEQAREASILQEISIKYHVVRRGDVLSRIAANNGTTVATICRLNGIKSTSILRVGQRLIVRDGVKPATSKTTASATATSTTTTVSNSSSSSVSSSAPSTYTIKSGDTLSGIARRYGTTIDSICSLNGISPNSTLRVGQRLRLSGSSSASTSTTSSQSSQVQYHTVKRGDTLSAIAKRYGTTVKSLCSLNGISENSILNLNQRIRLR